MMFRKFMLLSILLLSAVGCIKEDDDCPDELQGGLRLRFRFTYNTDNVDLLSARVQDIHVYLFDQARQLLVDTLQLGPTDITRGYVDVTDLPDGLYTITAWGGSSEDMMNNGFLDSQMNSSRTHNHTDQAVIGQTTLSEFRLMLSYDLLPEATHGDITSSTGHQFDDLFHAFQKNVSVVGTQPQTVDFDFIRNTNVLKIHVDGLDRLWSYNATRADGDRPLEVYTIARNGRYHYDNSIDLYAREVRYESPDITLTSKTMDVDIKTLRFDALRHSQEPVTLHMYNTESGEALMAPLDVVGTILAARDTRGNYVYPTQESIDREYEFAINVSVLTDLSVSVTVNGFEVVDLVPDIGRPK